MKKIQVIIAMLVLTGLGSCAETTKTDTTTHDADTMVIKENVTDSATNAISTDTTKR